MKPLSDLNLPALAKDPPAEKQGTLVRAMGHKPKHKISDRAQGVWDRLLDWYGVGKMSDFGDWPGPDLCRLIDSIQSLDGMRTFLANIRNNHPQWPPTFAEMEQLVRSIAVPSVDWGKLNEALARHVIRTRWDVMTPLQRMGIPPWTYGPDGVVIPVDGDSPAIFVGRDEVP